MSTPPFARSTVDLCELPFSFWQLPLLGPDKFIEAARERDVYLTPGWLEALHRVGLLVPFLRVRRDGREIAAAVRRQDSWLWERARFIPTETTDLRVAFDQDLVHDPATEGFSARQRFRRALGEITYNTSDYLYSHHQLLHLPDVRGVLSRLHQGPSGRFQGGAPPQLPQLRANSAAIREVVIACSALEPAQYPLIVLRTRSRGDEYERYRRWLKGQRGRAMMRWLGVSPDWLRVRGQGLLAEADRIDPLGSWQRVIREADPRGWESLRGDARIALDLRIGAEILFRYCERLAKARVPGARALPHAKPGHRDPFASRLKPTGKLNRVLTEHRVSPHPNLVFVVEGDTEALLLPRVYAHFDLRLDREFIAIENARGVDRDLTALVAFAISPQVEVEDGRRYLRMETPPTRLLAVMDAEGRYALPKQREEERRKLIERIMLTFPKRYRTPAAEESISGLITIETWNRKGESFEFAHFTDRQIAVAVGQAFQPKKKGKRCPSLKHRIDAVGRLRSRRGRLDELLGAGSKVDLAEALWPVLEKKISRAEGNKTERRIPIVRAIDLAGELAHEYPRAELVIPLERAG
jgi:hypothetical protein